MPAIHGIAETALYVADLARSGDWYETLFGVTPLMTDDRMRAYALPGGQILLLFVIGGSTQPTEMPGGTIPPHDASGHQHLAFRISPADVDDWKRALAAQNIPLESTVTCDKSGGGPGGGTSLYFRDPNGHCLELITPGCWAVY